MASKEEVAQLKKTVQELRKGQLDILIRLEVVGQTITVAERDTSKLDFYIFDF